MAISVQRHLYIEFKQTCVSVDWRKCVVNSDDLVYDFDLNVLSVLVCMWECMGGIMDITAPQYQKQH